MIPREMLKKIRQIERRTNREVGRATPCAPSVGHGHAPAGKELPALPEAGRPASPVAGLSKDAASVSPSPWRAGRDEGGLNCLNSTTDRLENLNGRNSASCDRLAEAVAGLADDLASFANDAASLANDAANLAGDAANLAGDAASLADDAANFADDAANLADDAANLADDAATFAGGAATRTNIPATNADGRDGFAQPAARVAEHCGRDAGARVFSAQRVFRHRGRQIHFSTP